MIGAQYLLTLFCSVAIGLRVVTAHAPTVRAAVPLLPFCGKPLRASLSPPQW